MNELNKALDEDDEEEEEQMKAQDYTCTTIKICIEDNTYTNIENITNANKVQKNLEENFKSGEFGFLNDSF